MRCLSSLIAAFQLMLNRSPDVVRLANGQFTCMGLEPLKQFVGGHDLQGHNGPVVSALDVLRVVQGLACEVFGQQGVGFKDNFFRGSLSQHGDAEGMGEVVFGMKGRLHLKFRVSCVSMSTMRSQPNVRMPSLLGSQPSRYHRFRYSFNRYGCSV